MQRLNQLVAKAENNYVAAVRSAALRGTPRPVRHKCFISYHGADIDGVTQLVDDFNDVFIPRVVGVSDSDYLKDPVNSQDEEYIKAQIGARYLSDSTVTILYVGKCTWARKYVDWELSSTLRDDSVNKRNGLLAITSSDRSTNTLPERFTDNWASDGSLYARYQYYPTSESSLRGWIEDAFQARTSRWHLINNSRALRKTDSTC
ncbi:MAG: TIR domain-containing protein [Chloroflexi bacterium]|nr:TIR domain-containing protein [Chloroflexota bacterium]